MKRRRFLESIVAGTGVAAFGCTDDHRTPASMPSGPRLLEGERLRELEAVANVAAGAREFSATLRAGAGEVALLPDVATRMSLYNGMYPGPLIELREGDRARLTLDNALSEDTTIHWHGLAVPEEQDGNPMDPVRPGERRTYDFTVPAGSAGTYWYHPHPHNRTAAQVASGLAGALIVRDDDDALSHVPEVTLLITAVRLAAGGAISPNDAIDWTVGRQRETLLVNGGRLPVHAVAPGATQRWRILNATSSRHFRLALEGHALTLVGTDGGLLGAPVGPLTEILVGPAQRVEVVVTASRTPNARFRLRALRYTADFLGLGSYADEDLLTMATTTDPVAPPLAVPTRLRPLADLGTPEAQQRVRFEEFGNLCTSTGATSAFFINGRPFDPSRIDLVTTVGRVETWDVVNATSMAHPFHIHGTQFQLVSTGSGAVVTPAPYLAWIDTVVVPAGRTVTIKTRQALPGRRMFHCHILEHEDNCMMAILDVRPS
ncbi:MAG: multicopper oxidase family protein [Burkholderiales bacterium]